MDLQTPLDNLFPSKWMKARDLTDAGLHMISARIDRVTVEEVQPQPGEKVQRLALHLHGWKPYLVTSKADAQTLAQYGANTAAELAGKTVAVKLDVWRRQAVLRIAPPGAVKSAGRAQGQAKPGANDAIGPATGAPPVAIGNHPGGTSATATPPPVATAATTTAQPAATAAPPPPPVAPPAPQPAATSAPPAPQPAATSAPPPAIGNHPEGTGPAVADHPGGTTSAAMALWPPREPWVARKARTGEVDWATSFWQLCTRLSMNGDDARATLKRHGGSLEDAAAEIWNEHYAAAERDDDGDASAVD